MCTITYGPKSAAKSGTLNSLGMAAPYSLFFLPSFLSSLIPRQASTLTLAFTFASTVIVTLTLHLNLTAALTVKLALTLMLTLT